MIDYQPDTSGQDVVNLLARNAKLEAELAIQDKRIDDLEWLIAVASDTLKKMYKPAGIDRENQKP